MGITTQVIRQAKWYKYVGRLGFEAVEINRQNSKLHFNLYFLEKVKRYLQGLDLSVHSGTSGVFQERDPFTRADLAVLAAEIDVCRFLGAGQLVFHLRDGFLSADHKRRLGEVVSRAFDCGVEMLYESNSTLVADQALDTLGRFPGLGYVLDLGHLNNGHCKGRLGCHLDDFVRQVRNRVVYVHASNNHGFRDEHNGLENGTLDWRRVLGLLDLTRIMKIIIEVRDTDKIAGTAAELVRYLDENRQSQNIWAAG